jgi:hypothetical protein
MIFIGLIVVVRIVRVLAAMVHPLLAVLVIVAYYFFLFGTWIASGIANFLILKDPVARMSLDLGEKVEGVVIGTLFCLGFVLLIAGIATGILPMAVMGGAMMVAAIPASMVFTNEARLGQIVFGACAAAVLLLGGGAAFQLASHPGVRLKDADAAAGMLGFAFLIAMGSTWLSLVPALRRVKPS